LTFSGRYIGRKEKGEALDEENLAQRCCLDFLSRP
jgi:hypothetical protein